MKKRYLLLIPVAACIIMCAAAIGYIQFHPDRAPAGAAFLVNASQAKQELDTGSGEEEVPQEEPKELTATQKRAQEIVADMTLEQKIYQMMFVTPEVLTDSRNSVVRAGNATKASITAAPVGGVLYTRQNLQGKDQTSVMLENTQQYAREAGAGIPVFTGIGEEGGSYAPAAAVLGTAAVNAMSAYGEANNSEEARSVGQTLAAAISGVGFNVDFAPVADVLSNESNTELENRTFGSDPAVVSNMVSNEISGMQENGVMSAISHFPGAGSTASSTENGTVTTERSLEEFQSSDLTVFEAGIEADAAFVVVSNMTAPAFDTVPCALSSKVITDLLRKEMGYDGIIITDKLTDAAITGAYSNGDAAVQAVQAGADMLLCPPSISDAYSAISEAVANGTITQDRIDESAARILTAKLEYGLMN
ncbi:MAG: glycoside hydrolase family 3 protein [Clostridia bacterium]|nr:glycoside hydrolase family 3 protein [Clostridia bacterium]